MQEMRQESSHQNILRGPPPPTEARAGCSERLQNTSNPKKNSNHHPDPDPHNNHAFRGSPAPAGFISSDGAQNG